MAYLPLGVDVSDAAGFSRVAALSEVLLLQEKSKVADDNKARAMSLFVFIYPFI
jgi:hypothetical protein